VKIIFAFLALVTGSASFAGTDNFDCRVSAPEVATTVDGKKMLQSMEGVPQEALSFKLKMSKKDIEVIWEQSPIFTTGEGAGAVIFLSSGPCLLTDKMCGSLLNYATQKDGSLLILITPTALVSEQDGSKRPFLAAIYGKCVKGSGA
jgi:hypothetical protein